MIQFFRKIRQKLLEQNRVSKYLVYALGEIILVVIGILIALQINNWNEDRKSAKKASELKEKLLTEISDIVDYIEFSSAGIEHQIAYLEMVMNADEGNMDSIMTKPPYGLSPMYYLTSYFQFFDPPSDVYETAINDGSILLINDKKLTRNLQEFHKSIKTRLDQKIEEEYTQSREINDYISSTYASYFENESVTSESKWSDEVTNKLFLELKKDGKIKYLLLERIQLKQTRQYLIKRYSDRFKNIYIKSTDD